MLEDIGHLFMGATVDDKRRRQRDNKHCEKTDARTRLVPYPHLVVNRTAIHRHDEGNRVQEQDILQSEVMDGEDIENDARKPEERRLECLHETKKILADRRKRTRHQGEHIEEHEHERQRDRNLDKIPVEFLAADEIDNHETHDKTELHNERRDAEDGGYTRQREFNLRDQVVVAMEYVDTGTQYFLNIEPRNQAAHEPQDIGRPIA